jgi:hypothetical protein
MKKIFSVGAVLILLFSCSAQQDSKVQLQTGDVIFQDFPSGLSTPIKLITNSEYSHVGVIIMIDGKPMVYEAVQPVRLGNFDEWIQRNEEGKYVVKRHVKSDSLFTDQKLKEINTFYKAHLNKDYDIKFAWSDKDMYCSELVWKLYDEVLDTKIGELELLEELDDSHPAVKKKLKELFGNDIPWKETVVSPQSLFESPNLVTIFKN